MIGKWLACATFVMAAGAAHAQGVGINATGAPADTSAILDLSSTSKGLLVPRLTSAQRAAIALPATGLVVFQTDGAQGLYWNAGTPASPSWKQVGEAGAGGGGQWTTSGPNIYYSAGKVAVGTTPSQFRFAVQDTGDVFRVQADSPNSVMASMGGFGQVQIDAPGIPGGRLALMDNGNLGLGVTDPTNKLSFAPVLGKKISLYPGATGDAGFGVSGNRLQIYADNPDADVAIGYDAAGTFNERFAVKPNGALAVVGNTGTEGQVLQSNGSNAAPSWVTPATNTAAFRTPGTGTVIANSATWVRVPGLECFAVISKPSHVIVTFSIPVRNVSATSPVTVDIGFTSWSNQYKIFRYTLAAGTAMVATGTFMYPTALGMDAIFVAGFSSSSPGAELGSALTEWAAEVVITVVPQ